MKKRRWIWLLCGLLAVQPALAAQTDGAVRVGEVVYDVQTVQNSLTASYQIYTASGVTLDTAQKQQLTDSVLERFVGLGVLENQLRKAGQADIDEAARQALDEQARQAYEEAAPSAAGAGFCQTPEWHWYWPGRSGRCGFPARCWASAGAPRRPGWSGAPGGW